MPLIAAPRALPPAPPALYAAPSPTENGLDRLFSGALPAPALELSQGLEAAPGLTVREQAAQGLAAARVWRADRVSRAERLKAGVEALPYGGRTRRTLARPLGSEAESLRAQADGKAAGLEGRAAALIEPGHGAWRAFMRWFSLPFRQALGVLAELRKLQDSVDVRLGDADDRFTALYSLGAEGAQALNLSERALAELERTSGPEPLKQAAAPLRRALERSLPLAEKDPVWAKARSKALNQRITALDARFVEFGRLEQLAYKTQKAVAELRGRAERVRVAAGAQLGKPAAEVDLSDAEALVDGVAEPLDESARALAQADFAQAETALAEAETRRSAAASRLDAAQGAVERRARELERFDIERRRLNALAMERTLALQQLSQTYSPGALAGAQAALGAAKTALFTSSDLALQAEERWEEGRPLGFVDALSLANGELSSAKEELRTVADSTLAVEHADQANYKTLKEVETWLENGKAAADLEAVREKLLAARESMAELLRDPAATDELLNEALEAAGKLEKDKGLLLGLETASRMLAETISGYGDIDYWIHHFSVRRDMMNGLGHALQKAAYEFSSPGLRDAVLSVAADVLSAPQTGRGDLHYWAAMPGRGEAVYGRAAAELDRLRLKAGNASGLVRSKFEQGVAAALAPAALALDAKTHGHGHMNYWIHHFEVRRDVSVAAARALEALAGSAGGSLASELRSLAEDIRNAPQHGYGDLHYWAAMSTTQDRALAVPARRMLALKERLSR